jgi:N-acetylglutamate synthase-like GNAT family acetyltransferase
MKALRRMDSICFPGESPADADTRDTLDEYDLSMFERSMWWVAEHDGKLVAYSGMRLTGNGDVGYLCRAGVLPSQRGKGLQKRMIRAKLVHAKRLKLKRLVTYTTPAATASGNNLIDCGFRLYRPDFLWGDNDWLYFKKDLA